MMLGNCPASSMMWFGGDLWWISALVVGLSIALVATLLLLLSSRRRPSVDPALDRLRMRLAGGEISEAEFESGRRALGA